MKIGFNKRLQALLAASGMSQEEAARHLGVSSSTMSRWVRGVRVPSAYQIRDLVHFFHLPYAWFLEGVFVVQEPEAGAECDDMADCTDGMDEADDSGVELADPGVEEMAAQLGLSPDTVEALIELAETGDDAVLDAVDHAVSAAVSAAGAAYDDIMRTVERSLQSMMEAAK